MKKLYALVVAVIILFVMAVSLPIVKAMVDIYMKSHSLTQLEYLLLGLIKILPIVIAVWLIKLSWRKITDKKEKESEVE